MFLYCNPYEYFEGRKIADNIQFELKNDLENVVCLDNLSVIIPTMQKDLNVLNKLIAELVDDNFVSEIIIIDNSTNGFSYPSGKVKVISPEQNLYVNPAWNIGVNEAKCNYIAILNDDLILPENYCSEVLNFIKNTENVGLVGIDTKALLNTNKEDFNTYPLAETLEFEKMDSCYDTGFWGSAIFGKKENYHQIPENIKIWCGDNYLQKMNIDNGKQNYQVINAQIKHLVSLSVNSSKEIKRILHNDIRNYSKIDKRYKGHDFYRPDFVGTLFSMRTRDCGKHKILTVFGIKISIKNKSKKRYKLQDKKAYYEFLENRNTVASSCFVEYSDKAYDNSNSVKPIAFYLPQFHSIELNDENFGKGFTEWVNVSKAFPQFVGHHQPQIPVDVGFYDLSDDKVMYRQVELAKHFGIFGFCFHYYWFSGKRLLEKPIFNYLNNKELDLPFCLCWANENWSKLWDGGNKELLMEQKLLEDDDEKFFYDILPFFRDDRYIKIDNKPVLIVYRLNLFSDERIKVFVNKIRDLAKKEGFDDIYLVGAKVFGCENPLIYGADAAVEFPPLGINTEVEEAKLKYLNKNYKGTVYDITSYVKSGKYVQGGRNSKLFKSVFPGWDNTARKAQSGAWTFLCEPDIYKTWLKNIINWTKKNHKNADEQFVFINAWNEWAEGAHLEPDKKYGYAYLQATKDALEESK